MKNWFRRQTPQELFAEFVERKEDGARQIGELLASGKVHWNDPMPAPLSDYLTRHVPGAQPLAYANALTALYLTGCPALVEIANHAAARLDDYENIFALYRSGAVELIAPQLLKARARHGKDSIEKIVDRLLETASFDQVKGRELMRGLALEHLINPTIAAYG